MSLILCHVKSYANVYYNSIALPGRPGTRKESVPLSSGAYFVAIQRTVGLLRLYLSFRTPTGRDTLDKNH